MEGGTGSYGNASVKTPDNFPFTDYRLVTEVSFTNASRMADDEANFDRKKVIGDAIRLMLDGDNEGDFKNDGTPNLNALQKRVGFAVQREEADAIFAEISQEGAGD